MNKFRIISHTYSLKDSGETDVKHLLNGVQYTIPVYQRPYSWNEEQIHRFIRDITAAYSDKDVLFIGPMQLSEKKQENGQAIQEIIDGQQRLTTCFILFKVFQMRHPDSQKLKEIIDFKQLKTETNNGTQQEKLEKFLALKSLPKEDDTLRNSGNIYIRNAYLIDDKLDELMPEQENQEQDKVSEEELCALAEYILSHLRFVVIETHANLVKTLQVFNTINTAGLQLNEGDLFKIQLFSYLRVKYGRENAAFNEINALYKKIDDKNEEARQEYKIDYDVTNIIHIQQIYQHIIIAKYHLSNELHRSYGVGRFWDGLFSAILTRGDDKNFAKNKVQDVKLDLNELHVIVDAVFQGDKEFRDLKHLNLEEYFSEAFVAHKLRWRERNRLLIYMFIYRFGRDANLWEKFARYITQLSKLCFIYTLRFGRDAYRIQGITWEIMKRIVHSSYDELLKYVNDEIGTYDKHKGWPSLEGNIHGPIAWSGRWKYAVCTLSAMLEENRQTRDVKEIQEIRQKLIWDEIDIEHIRAQAVNSRSGDEAWGDTELNGIGNLVVLERDINRSISDNSYADKVRNYDRKRSYPKSKYAIVQKQIEDHPNEWTREKCQERKEAEVKKILDYLFPKASEGL